MDIKQLDDSEKFVIDELIRFRKENAELRSLVFDYWNSHKKLEPSNKFVVSSGGFTIEYRCSCLCCVQALKFLKGI